MKKIAKIVYISFVLIAFLGVVFADALEPTFPHNKNYVSQPVENNVVNNSVSASPIVLMVVGILVAIAISALIIIGLNKAKNSLTENEEKQPEMASAVKEENITKNDD